MVSITAFVSGGGRKKVKRTAFDDNLLDPSLYRYGGKERLDDNDAMIASI